MKEDIMRICIYNRKDMLFSGVYEFKTINGIRTTRKVVGYGASEKSKPMGLLEYIKELKKSEVLKWSTSAKKK